MKVVLTPKGQERIVQAFVDRWGDRRKYDSVKGLDRRTVSKILHRQEGALVSSLQVLFAGCALTLEDTDYGPCASPSPPSSANGNPPVAQEIISSASPALVPVGGAMPLESDFYVQRPEDALLHAAIARREGIVRIKGQHQSGKTSLLSRGLQQARRAGANVIYTECLRLEPFEKESLANFYAALAESIAEQLDIEPPAQPGGESLRSAGANFERYLKREILSRDKTPLVWGIDDADALFTLSDHSSVFSLLRSLFDARSTRPAAGWDRLTLIITYSTEAHLLIANPNLSPFNVGTRLALRDFTLEQVRELNRRYGEALNEETEIPQLYELVGGHPFLVRSCLHEIAQSGKSLAHLQAAEQQGDGIFGPHLERMRAGIAGDAGLSTAVKELLRGSASIDKQSFLRLRSAGVIVGGSEVEARFRCRLFEWYLKSQLLLALRPLPTLYPAGRFHPMHLRISSARPMKTSMRLCCEANSVMY